MALITALNWVICEKEIKIFLNSLGHASSANMSAEILDQIKDQVVILKKQERQKPLDIESQTSCSPSTPKKNCKPFPDKMEQSKAALCSQVTLLYTNKTCEESLGLKSEDEIHS